MTSEDLFFSSKDSPADMSRKIKQLEEDFLELRESLADLSLRYQLLCRIVRKYDELPWNTHSKMEKPDDRDQTEG